MRVLDSFSFRQQDDLLSIHSAGVKTGQSSTVGSQHLFRRGEVAHIDEFPMKYI